jgi:hypothetical protein
MDSATLDRKCARHLAAANRRGGLMMQTLREYLEKKGNAHTEAGNPRVKCNAVYKTRSSFNCYLTPSQAIEHARHLLHKAQLILDNNITDAVVQVWNKGEQGENLYFGLTQARKGKRKKAKKST